MKQVLIAAPISEKFKNYLTDNNYELVYFEPGNLQSANPQPPNPQLIEAIVTSNKLLLNKTALEKYPQLKWIGRLGSGMEIIDTACCNTRGIRYFSAPAGIANSVAEHITGMLLSLLHNIHSSGNEIRNGLWIREANRGLELENLTTGIIGFGHTGSRLAQKLSVFTDKILVYDKYRSHFPGSHIREVSLQQLQQEADIVSFHVPLNAGTRHYYNEEFMSGMKKDHILINASRGAVADSATILQGLESGKITGACLDVLQEESDMQNIMSQENNIIQQMLRYNVIITPHIAGYSHNAIEKMCDELIAQLSELP